MEMIKYRIPGGPYNKVCIAPLGDFQWTGKGGHTALGHLKRHIQEALSYDAHFIGLGDYIDFLSPSNRTRIKSAALYDTAEDVIEAAGIGLMEEILKEALLPTVGKWIGLLEGHHFSPLKDGRTTDTLLADKLDTVPLGTSALIKVEFLAHPIPGERRRRPFLASTVIWAHHGIGGGVLPGATLNKLYHQNAGWERVDVFLTGHSTKLAATRLSRPFADWENTTLEHRDVLLVNTGGFCKSSIVGNKSGPIPRGDYAEQGMMTPSPLCAPLIFLKAQEGSTRADVNVLI
jgi:hypothetical protein